MTFVMFISLLAALSSNFFMQTFSFKNNFRFLLNFHLSTVTEMLYNFSLCFLEATTHVSFKSVKYKIYYLIRKIATSLNLQTSFPLKIGTKYALYIYTFIRRKYKLLCNFGPCKSEPYRLCE